MRRGSEEALVFKADGKVYLEGEEEANDVAIRFGFAFEMQSFIE
ncbi:MAG: hypothetical protein N2327_05815 [Caldimicrobium sp.]|nr:hypothetical protein [Caldimicrobium sp.]MCX7873927.1 hypothetical protein [Caldimicrobium sp.]MDW8094280.1 hypothetical protein [Caldimicrobium sp.]